MKSYNFYFALTLAGFLTVFLGRPYCFAARKDGFGSGFGKEPPSSDRRARIFMGFWFVSQYYKTE